MKFRTRRQYLRAVGVVGVAGVAGCSEIGGGGDPRPTTDAAMATETRRATDTQTATTTETPTLPFEEGFEDGDVDEWTAEAEEDEGLLSASRDRVARGQWAGKVRKDIQHNPSWHRPVGGDVRPSKVRGSMYVDGEREVRLYWASGSEFAFWLNVDLWNSPHGIRWSANRGTTIAESASQRKWYHFVVRDIDWDAGRVGEVLVDGAVAARDLPFDDDVSSINNVRIRMKGSRGGTGYWDDIHMSG